MLSTSKSTGKDDTACKFRNDPAKAIAEHGLIFLLLQREAWACNGRWSPLPLSVTDFLSWQDESCMVAPLLQLFFPYIVLELSDWIFDSKAQRKPKKSHPVLIANVITSKDSNHEKNESCITCNQCCVSSHPHHGPKVWIWTTMLQRMKDDTLQQIIALQEYQNLAGTITK